MRDIPRLGFFVDPPEDARDPDGVFGRDIAVDGFFDALLTHAPPSALCLFHAAPVYSRKTPDFSHFKARKAKHVSLQTATTRALKDDFDSWKLSIFHDFDGDLQNAITLRQRFSSRLFPVTATPHVFSYPYLAHQMALRLLLQPGLPCDAMICPTPSARQAFTQLIESVSEGLEAGHGLKTTFAPQTPVIPLGLDTDVFRPRDKKAVRAQLDLPQDAVLVTWIGRLSALDKADLLPLLNVFADVVQSCPGQSPVLLIGGSGNRFSETTLEAQVAALGLEDRVLFREVPGPERHLFYAASDIFVSPAESIQETFGLTPIEAMACGVPQLVSDWDGYRHTVVDDVTGFLIPTLTIGPDDHLSASAGVYDGLDMLEHLRMGQRIVVDPKTMYQRMLTLIHDAGLRDRMGRASRQRACEVYDWRHVISAYFDLWQDLGERAKKLPWSPPVRYDGGSLLRIFGHYATRLLSETTMLSLSQAGMRVFEGQMPMSAFHSQLGLVSTDLLRACIKTLAAAPQSFASLMHDLDRNADCGQEVASAHILWLLKYGYADHDAAVAKTDGQSRAPSPARVRA